MRKRIFIALVLALLGTIVGAWSVTGGGVLRPLTKKLVESRADIVSTLASEIEQAENPQRRLRELSRRLDLEAKLRRKPLKNTRGYRVLERSGREIKVLPGRDSPMIAEVTLEEKSVYLTVLFPISLNDPKRKVAQGLLILAAGAIFAAYGLSKWSTQPLDRATQAMHKIAAGELSYRVEEDIGEAKEAFNQMASRVEDVILGQRQLIAAISHELRTPLTRLRLQTELLSDSGVATAKINRINEDIGELDTLVDILLNSARLEQGSVALRRQEIYISDVVMEALSQTDLEERYIKMNIEELNLQGDGALLVRAVTNILSNIARYTPKDCVVEITAKKIKTGMLLRVSDTGEGVSDDFLPQIFTPFAREERSRSKVTGGLGLGMMFVKKVILAHGGSIEAVANQPHGLIVRIELPLTTSSDVQS